MNTNTSTVSSKMGASQFALLIKLGPILLKFVPKMLKTIFSLKAGLVVASSALYSGMFHSWVLGLLLVAALAVHEYGHVWAMMRCGLKTKGMYMIPGFGAVAIASESFKSARNEAYIAIMGPIFGTFFFVVPVIGLYFWTGEKAFAGIAGFASFINLLNLFPINPLDGGRMMKTFMHSLHEKIGFFIMCAIGLSAVILSYQLGLGLLAFMAVIGMLELLTDYGITKMVPQIWNFVKLSITLTLSIFLVLLLGIGSSLNMFKFILVFMGLFVTGLTIALQCMKIAISIQSQSAETLGERTRWAFDSYISDIILEWKNFRLEGIKRVDNYPPLSRPQFAVAVISYLAMILILLALIIWMSKVPGLDILKGVLE